MQTFLPYRSFKRCARVLDGSRLGNQGYRECLTLIQGGWEHHPAARMWAVTSSGEVLTGRLNEWLKVYANAMLQEWVDRGNSTTVWFDIDATLLKQDGMPWWFKDRVILNRVLSSHRSNLLRKNPDHYNQFGWTEPDNLPYFWPVRRVRNESAGVYLDEVHN